MIQKNDDGFGFTVACDEPGCSNYEELDCESFYEAVEEMRSLGWKAKKINGEWLHSCPACEE